MACIRFIKQKYKNCLILTNNIIKKRCKISLGEFDNSTIIIDGDLYKQEFHLTEKICDCFIFHHSEKGVIIVIIECKSNNVKVDYVGEQLEESIKVVQKILSEFHINKSTLYPVLLSKSISSIDRRLLKRKVLNFYGKQLNIFRYNCNCNFDDIVRID
ncbi:Uncharacterised protein [uncultured archaeon]|nr:Uncharacterised protein [uncultured archaeon]